MLRTVGLPADLGPLHTVTWEHPVGQRPHLVCGTCHGWVVVEGTFCSQWELVCFACGDRWWQPNLPLWSNLAGGGLADQMVASASLWLLTERGRRELAQGEGISLSALKTRLGDL